MFTAAYEAARNRQSEDEATPISSQCLPDSYSFSQLHGELAGDKTLGRARLLQNLLVLASCLEYPSRLTREAGDEDIINKIASWISKIILPDGSTIPQDDGPSSNVLGSPLLTVNSPCTDSQAVKINQAVATAQRLGFYGLKCLQSMLTLRLLPPGVPDQDILLSAIAFTSLRDPWTTASSESIAATILREHSHEIQTSELIIDFLLHTVIRPLFSQSKPATITATGRKAMPSSAPPRNYSVLDSFDPSQKPWKYASPFSIAVFEWIVKNTPEEIVDRSWNLFIPPLATLLDDTSTPIRSRGLSILSAFLPKMGEKRLKLTGLGDVFEDAVMPTLMFLPSITPVDESMQLLEPGYNALFVLSDVKWGLKDPVDIGRESESRQEEMKFYDRIMRKGILSGYSHAHEHLKIVEVLTREIGTLVEKMGIHAVKHLKEILPILSYGLTDPFNSSLQLLLTTIRTLRSVILACWPRISQPIHRRIILKSIVVCWKNLEDDNIDQSNVKEELRSLAELFITCSETTDTDSNINSEVSAVVDADPRLEELFGH